MWFVSFLIQFVCGQMYGTHKLLNQHYISYFICFSLSTIIKTKFNN